MNFIEHEIRKKYRYSNLSYVFDVYMECEYRANLTQEEYDGLLPGEFRFDYESWGRRLGFTKKQMERAIKELTTKSVVIIQTVRGNKGTSSKYFLTRFSNDFEENNKENNEEHNRRIINLENTSIKGNRGEQKEQYKEKKKAHSSQYNNLNIISNNIYSSNDYEEIWKAYPNKKGKARSINYINKILKSISKEELLRCIHRYKQDVEKQRANGFKTLSYKNGSTFFYGGYIDYLDENYQEENTKEEDSSYGQVVSLEELLGRRV